MVNDIKMFASKSIIQLSPLCLRLITGTGFIIHGWAKISRGTAGFEKLIAQLGIPFPHFGAAIIPYIELVGGIMLLLGMFVFITCIPLLITMITAMLTIHIHYGFSSIKTIGLTDNGPVFGPPGYEINLLYIAALLSLMITGAGSFSVDYLRRKDKVIHPSS